MTLSDSSQALASASSNKTGLRSHCSPWLTPIVYPLGCKLLLPSFFGRITVTGQEHLPTAGPVLLAPTHRSRWDALLVPYAAGRLVTGRNLRFMVTATEVRGLQGWFIRRLGGFPVNPERPAIASLRLGVELLQQREMLVIFPEGGIFRDGQVHDLRPGPARIALQAEASQPDLGVKVVPMSLRYDPVVPHFGADVNIRIGKPLAVADYRRASQKENAKQLTHDLKAAMTQLDQAMPDPDRTLVAVR